MNSKCIIIDYGMGNLHSVYRKLKKLGAGVIVSSNAQDILASDKIILPGVGHFGKAMANIKNLGLIETLNEAVLTKRIPVLGICLGMQLMAQYSEEGNCAGFGWIDAGVVRFQVSNTQKFKIPHMGWNTLTQKKQSMLLEDIHEKAEFYFVHSYYMQPHKQEIILTETEYDIRYCSAIELGNVFGVQFHPEKSHLAGMQILANFLKVNF